MKIAEGGYRQLLRQYLAPQRGAVALMAMLLLAGIGLQLAGPQVARYFIDAVQAGAAQAVLVRAALAFIALAALQQAMKVLAAYWSERVAWTATNNLRADLAAHLVHLDLTFHKARTPGELIERVDGDVTALGGFFSGLAVQLVGSALLLGGILIVVCLVSAWLGLAFVAFAALGLAALSWIRQFGIPHWHAEREQSAGFYGYVGEVLAATEDIRSSGAVPYAMRQFFRHLRVWWPIRQQAALWGQAVMMAGIALFAVGDAVAYGVGGGLYRAHAISLGTVYTVIAYAAMLAEPIENIRNQLQELQRAEASIARVRELLATRSRLRDGAEAMPAGPLAVELRGVCFGYDDGQGLLGGQGGEPAVVLEEVSFRLEAGRVLGLLGRTGSGKTTIARLLFRLYDVQQGEVLLNGVDLRRLKLSALRARVGLVTQDVQLFGASLRDNITFFDPEMPDGTVLAVLEKLGLGPWLARLPEGLDTPITASSLSAGEAQLLALARVFLKDPGLIILDEASSRLDPASEALLERALDRLLEGRTAVIVAHRLATLERADDILILEGGRIWERGAREELAGDPHSRFAQLCRMGLAEVLA